MMVMMMMMLLLLLLSLFDDDDGVNDDDMTPGWSPSRAEQKHVSMSISATNNSIYLEDHPDDIDDDGCRQ